MIRTYTNTKAELNTVRLRLELLMNRKEEIYERYFSTASKLKDVPARTNKLTDAMASYMAEITEPNPITGKSLDEEIEEKRNEVNLLRYYVNLMEYELKRAKGIEHELFSSIVLDGNKPSRAVEEVADKHNKHPDTIWKYHYPKIKSCVDKLKKGRD